MSLLQNTPSHRLCLCCARFQGVRHVVQPPHDGIGSPHRYSRTSRYRLLPAGGGRWHRAVSLLGCIFLQSLSTPGTKILLGSGVSPVTARDPMTPPPGLHVHPICQVGLDRRYQAPVPVYLFFCLLKSPLVLLLPVPLSSSPYKRIQRFQVHYSTTHPLNTVVCAHHPKSSVLLLPLISPVPLVPPPILFLLVITYFYL